MLKVDNINGINLSQGLGNKINSRDITENIFEDSSAENSYDLYEKTLEETENEKQQTIEKKKRRNRILIGIGAGLAVAATVAISIASRKSRIDNNFGKEILNFLKRDNFEKMPMFKDLNEEEISILREQFYQQKSSFVTYLGTITGAKPACWVDFPIEAITKHKFPTKLDIRITSWGGTFLFNPKETLKVIARNKDIFTERLGLARNTEINQIYQKILDTCGKVPKSADEIIVDNSEDLMGLLVGFSRKNSMIFQLESAYHGLGDYNPVREELRRHPKKLSKTLLEFLHSSESPYKNLDPKELEELEKAIKKIKNPYKKRTFRKRPAVSQSLYGAVSFTDDPEEFKRIHDTSRKFLKSFKVENYLKQPEHLYEPQSFIDRRNNVVFWVGDDGYTYCKYVK